MASNKNVTKIYMDIELDTELEEEYSESEYDSSDSDIVEVTWSLAS